MNTTTRRVDLIACKWVSGDTQATSGYEALYTLPTARYLTLSTVGYGAPRLHEIDAEDAWVWLRDRGFHDEAAELAEIGT